MAATRRSATAIIERFYPPGMEADVIVPPGHTLTMLAQPSPLHRGREQPEHGLGHALQVVGIHEQPGFSREYGFHDSARREGHHGDSHGHGLDDDSTEGFFEGGEEH